MVYLYYPAVLIVEIIKTMYKLYGIAESRIIPEYFVNDQKESG